VNLRIVHTFGRHAGDVVSLGKDVVRIGRAPDNDVVFDAEYDRDASGYHAEVRREGEAWTLVDLDSKNGTWVRGERVNKHVVQAGDEVGFGPKGPRLRLDFSDAAPSAKAPSAGARSEAPPAGAPRVRRPMPPTAAAFVLPPEIQNLPLAKDPPPAPPPPSSASAPPNPHAPRSAAAPLPATSRARLAAPAAGARVGKRTIAQMISDAMGSARKPRNTIEISRLVDHHVGEATAGQRRTARTLTVVLFLALAALAALFVWSRRSHDEMDRLRSELAALPPEDPRRKDIEGRLGTMHPPSANFGRTLYDRSKKGIFMLAAGGEGFCTAFAVRPSVLATNAHCVLGARRHGGTIVALENEGHGRISFPVVDMKAHPGFREQDMNALTPDVGIVTISGRAAVVLQVASADELAKLGAGDEVYLIGFPGRLMDPSNPSATFLAAHVGRVTTAGGRPGAFADTWLVQHDAATTHGTSGSPVFDGHGKVVAINAGGYVESDDATIAGRKTEVVRASPYKFGMRIDLLNAILR
jgi:hypothetical protein